MSGNKNTAVKELLESYADEIHVTAACEGLLDFEKGFKLGVLLMLDVFGN